MEQTFSEISFEILGIPRKVGLKIPENRNNRKIPFGHSCSCLVSPSQEIEFNKAGPQASKHNIAALSHKRLKYLTATLLQWISLNKL